MTGKSEIESKDQVKSSLVVVAEDEETMAEMLKYKIEKMGYEVRLASDGQTAFELIASTKPLVSFIDLGLSGIDGLAVIRNLRADDRGQKLRLVVLSGQDDPAVIQAALDGGADDYLVKPVASQALANCLTISPKEATRFNNFASLRNWLDGDKAAFVRILEKVLAVLPVYMNEMQTAVSAGQPQKAADIAHKTRSAISQLDAPELDDLLQDWEIKARAGLDPSFELVDSEVKVLLDAIGEVLADQV